VFLADARGSIDAAFGEKRDMQCDRAHELISARIDREIIFDDAVLDDHLQTCVTCRDELDGLRRLEPMLWRAYAPEREAADVLVDKVKATLQARGRQIRRCTVLLVDDYTEILHLFAGQLADEFDVVTAGSAREAQAKFHDRRIDIVLTDQRMADMTGVELLEWVLANHPKTQRLLWTGHGDLDAAIAAVNRGNVFRYLTKPADIGVVRSALQAAAQISQLEREYERVLREMSELNVHLEERVRQRTRELEEANRELEQRTQTLEKFALTDGLTLLPNRRALDHFVERELYHCRRFPAPLAVAIIDVDFFREVNTKFHHPAGDYVLAELAKCMAGALRKIDMLGRWAGDEFMLIAPQTQQAGALVLAERLRTLVECHSFEYNGYQIPVTVTIGLAVLEAGRTADYDQVKQTAAAALARAKANGHNCVEFTLVPPAAAEDNTPTNRGNAASA
jgi:diguanylate cyclase (GGDEF)-like protein